MARILHVLSQRPSSTGSGVTLDALVRHSHHHDQHVVCGMPAGVPKTGVGGLDSQRIHPLEFGTGDLPFPVPGMSDVMPYPSTVFSQMSGESLEAYRRAWRRHLRRVADVCRPDIVHSHHVWIVSAMMKDVVRCPVVDHCHATGLRQMELCPHLADDVREGCARNDAFVVLTPAQGDGLRETLGVEPGRIRVVGAGYREDVFHLRGRETRTGRRVLYVGKFSPAKGLPWLLDAVEQMPDLELHVAGAGSGDEAEALERRMTDMEAVTMHGQLDQPSLARLMRRCDVLVLPSFYEGVPLVLVEALACGCRPVATRLPGVMQALAPRLGDALVTVEPPRLSGVDTPETSDLPAFVERLRAAIEENLALPPLEPTPSLLEPFGWGAVQRRVETVWNDLLAGR